MGCGISFLGSGQTSRAGTTTVAPSKWKSKTTKRESLAKYLEDGSLPSDANDTLLQLRVYMEEPTIMNDICKYGKQMNLVHLLICWSDVLEYKAIPPLALDLLSSHMLHIFHKYIKNENSKIVMPTEYVKDMSEKVEELAVALEAGVSFEEKSSLSDTIRLKILPEVSIHMFDELQQECLKQICDKIFIPYKSTSAFISKQRELDANVNLIKPDDFEYFELLGQGGFGCVVHASKKSTGKHYAMKIQTKEGMLNNFSDCPERVVLEKDGIASCKHPFIIGMDYAFQSRGLTFMAMDLGEEGTLRDAMDNAMRGVLSLERVQFYSAEIFLALAHMHRLGLIYRDLKPHNVILNRDGHIQLVDMGGIVDVGGKVCGYHGNEVMGGLFAVDYESKHIPSTEASAIRNPAPKTNENTAKKRNTDGVTQRAFRGENTFKMSTVKPKRANSIMGTNGYMAPEILIMEVQNNQDSIGYTHAVDYWSLGVLMFKLLTNSLPFKNRTVTEFAIYYANLPPRGKIVDKATGGEKSVTVKPHAFDAIDRALMMVPDITEECISIITGFLEVREEKRLGFGTKGVDRIKCHPFYNGIKWSLMSQKFIPPPYIPPPKVEIISDDPYDSFENMMLSINKPEWLQSMIGDRNQRYFAYWDYISPAVVVNEMNIEEARQSSNALFVKKGK